jgi:Mlc titration factor MtfA (ptsG expression regulator)
MLAKLRKWRNNRILARSPYTNADWKRASVSLAAFDRLSDYQLATLFIHEKNFSGAHEFEITDAVKQSIALQACLPILELGLDWYAGWSSIIVYPAEFRTESTFVDEFGVTHTESSHRSGEAWLRGPVILSWIDVEYGASNDGYNVVIHEFVHKLDMLNGRANGFPPMHSGVDKDAWTGLMSAAFDDFQVNPREGLDQYGATDPAEFFAVMSEVFFETPQQLVDEYPNVYDILSQFFCQSPLEQSDAADSGVIYRSGY